MFVSPTLGRPGGADPGPRGSPRTALRSKDQKLASLRQAPRPSAADQGPPVHAGDTTVACPNRWIVRRVWGIRPQRVQVIDTEETRRVLPQGGVV